METFWLVGVIFDIACALMCVHACVYFFSFNYSCEFCSPVDPCSFSFYYWHAMNFQTLFSSKKRKFRSLNITIHYLFNFGEAPLYI